MIIHGILNPAINSLLSRVRHTNTLLIADRGFPSLPGIETVDISLISGIPRVAEVLQAIRTNFTFGNVVMASEFRDVSSEETRRTYDDLLQTVSVIWEPHAQFKVRARGVTGIIRTGDATRFGNIILESK